MIKIGIVGTGSMANAHAIAFGRLGKSVKVTSCCDVSRAVANAFARRHGCERVYLDYQEMFAAEPLDAVSVVTPDNSHAAISIAAMKRGLAVLCDKPLATSADDAWKMVRAAKRSGVINMVNFSYRNSSAVQKARLLIEDGQIGEVIHLEASYLQSWIPTGLWRKNSGLQWRMSTKNKCDGVLGDLGCHIVDMVSFVAGPIRQIYCQLKNFDKGLRNNIYKGYTFDANDSALMNVELSNGGLGVIHTTRWACGHSNSLLLRVFGSKGGLKIDLDRHYGKLWLSSNQAAKQGVWKEVNCGKTPDVYQRFVRSIRTGVNDNPSFEDGARVQSYLSKCHESCRLNTKVSISASQLRL